MCRLRHIYDAEKGHIIWTGDALLPALGSTLFSSTTQRRIMLSWQVRGPYNEAVALLYPNIMCGRHEAELHTGGKGSVRL
ncbi:unnamed protein product [Hydatigera taeniaeformis]|uniref:Alpha-galactosidase n=1 Tax=Hydatigena taeniaeformis TaxID=6205 RepID=A0A0R3WNA9_HYDTA|nr:unnamed protein product [Hydatigera taeniaeformis]